MCCHVTHSDASVLSFLMGFCKLPIIHEHLLLALFLFLLLPLILMDFHSYKYFHHKYVESKEGGGFFFIPKSWLKCLREDFAGTEQEVELHCDNLLLHLLGAVRRGRNAHFPATLSDLVGSS